MYTPNPDIRITDLEDELVLLNPHTQDIYTLNTTGRLLWLALPATLDSLVQKLQQAYDLPEAEARADVQEVLQHLLQAKLVQDT